ncbi:MAG: type II toxin-antitoxin system RelE/ParE family toxin [Inhella sp.]
MRIAFRPEAQEELLEAQAWYEARAEGLGIDFARAFEVALLSAQRHPDGFHVVEADIRRVLLRRFPYALFYRVRDEEFLVVAVFHHRRDPAFVVRRLKARPDP